jgi:GTP-binding protein
VGRSNVGKSSLINDLFRQKNLARVSRTPGKTQLINFFKIQVSLPRGLVFYCVDLPGYGYAKVPAEVRSRWAPLIEGYLSHRRGLKEVFVLLDIRHDPSPLDLQLHNWLRSLGIPAVWVATKSDLLPHSKIRDALDRIRLSLNLTPEDSLLPVSARTGEGRKDLLHRIRQSLD